VQHTRVAEHHGEPEREDRVQRAGEAGEAAHDHLNSGVNRAVRASESCRPQVSSLVLRSAATEGPARCSGRVQDLLGAHDTPRASRVIERRGGTKLRRRCAQDDKGTTAGPGRVRRAARREAVGVRRAARNRN
jgi:hypothetical protein